MCRKSLCVQMMMPNLTHHGGSRRRGEQNPKDTLTKSNSRKHGKPRKRIQHSTHLLLAGSFYSVKRPCISHTDTNPRSVFPCPMFAHLPFLSERFPTSKSSLDHPKIISADTHLKRHVLKKEVPNNLHRTLTSNSYLSYSNVKLCRLRSTGALHFPHKKV